MTGHVFLWRSGPATLLIFLQPMLGLIPIVAASFLFTALISLGAERGGLLVGIALLVAVVLWACCTTGKVLLVRPSGVRTVSVFWGVVYGSRRLSLDCEIHQGGGFDFDEVIIVDGDVMLCIETSLSGDGPLVEELQRALGRARLARCTPELGGPRPISRDRSRPSGVDPAAVMPLF